MSQSGVGHFKLFFVLLTSVLIHQDFSFNAWDIFNYYYCSKVYVVSVLILSNVFKSITSHVFKL